MTDIDKIERNRTTVARFLDGTHSNRFEVIDETVALNAARVAVAFALMVVPATALGTSIDGAYVGGFASLPFFFGGLAVMHWALRRSNAAGLWLGLLYGLLIVFGWPAVILMLIGLVDTIFDFRGRAGPPPASPAT